MTMTRQTKRQHTAQLITAATTGYTEIQFQSPLLRRDAIADRGHARMTGREYVAHRMDRGQMPECRIELAAEMRGRIHRQQRIIGGRRITGLARGTKKPVTWTAHAVERTFRAVEMGPYTLVAECSHRNYHEVITRTNLTAKKAEWLRDMIRRAAPAGATADIRVRLS